MRQFHWACDAVRDFEFDTMAAFGSQGWAMSVRPIITTVGRTHDATVGLQQNCAVDFNGSKAE